MNKIITRLAADKILWWGTLASLTLVLADIVFLMIFYRNLPPYLPLFNQLPWGMERLGTRIEILIPIMIVLTMLITNIVLSSLYYEKMPLLSRILSVTSFLVSLISTILIVHTILLVI